MYLIFYLRVVVSLPVDVSSDDEMAKAETKGARGRYVAVERVQELENGKIEWRLVVDVFLAGRELGSEAIMQNGHLQHAWRQYSEIHRSLYNPRAGCPRCSAILQMV